MESQVQGMRAAESSSNTGPAAEPSALRGRTAPPPFPGLPLTLESTLAKLEGSPQTSPDPEDGWTSLLLPPWGRAGGGSQAP